MIDETRRTLLEYTSAKNLEKPAEVFSQVDWLQYETELCDWMDLLLCFSGEKIFGQLVDKIGLLDHYQEETLEYFHELLVRLQHPRRLEVATFLGLESSKPELIRTQDYSHTFLSRYLQLFQGRSNIHARQFIEAERTGYRPVHQRLDFELLKQHLNGEISLGVYTLQADSKVSFCALDFDIRKAILNAAMEPIHSLVDGLLPEVLENMAVFESEGLAPILEFSGYKGYHIWLFFHEPIQARVVREYFRTTIQPHLKLSSAYRFEFFPKQNELKEGGLGNLIKLPLGKHLKTGNFSHFLDRNGRHIPDVESLLNDIRPIFRNRFFKLCSKNVSYRRDNHQQRSFKKPFKEKIKFKSTGDQLALAKLFSGCDTLRTLRQKILNHHVASSQEAHVLTYLLTPLGEDGIAEIHRILSHTMGYNHDVVNEKIKAVAPHFMSCPKVRQRIPETCENSDCNCEFAQKEGTYPTPLLHVGLEPKTSGPLKRKPLISRPLEAGTGKGIDRWVEDYTSLKQRMSLIHEKLRDLELLIRDELKKNPGMSLQTKYGSYALKDGPGFNLEVKKVPLLDQGSPHKYDK